MTELTQSIGQKIQHFRLLRHLSVEQLAETIGKTKGTVYKYESGAIAIDIVTLVAIAQALSIHLFLLLDEPLALQQMQAIPNTEHKILYLYHYDGRYQQVIRSQIQVFPGEKAVSMFYYNVLGDRLDTAQYLYEGTLYRFENMSYFHFQNTQNKAEFMSISSFNPWGSSGHVWGLFTGVLDSVIVPSASKILLSRSPVEEILLTKENLQIQPQEMKQMKTSNFFVIHRGDMV